MFRINSRFARQAIAAFALTVGVSTISFAQTATSSTPATTTSTTQTNGATQALIDILTCTYCNGGGRIVAK
ncbi:hypothetical protein [Dyella acidisoli]|uniref:Uncharacterized protein n=1 Tax=Dyella acidisoli TaxID=1867834 RepID=A0ABQ5XV03_9GAMM|nr:hypothetical protein [Dyella acidisoli]GLQ94793.1 hypothetical protein GCM10007901_37450 [Dyella acidisoli]